jgi:uncharacterized protein (TIGR00251 family)
MNIMFDRYFIADKEGNCKIYLKVKAGAKKTTIYGFQEIEDKLYLKIFIQQAPEQGKANIAIISLFSKILKYPKSSIEIIQGLHSPLKLLVIKNIDPAYLKNKILPYIA